MASTNFTNSVTLTDADWFDDTDTRTYSSLTTVAGTNTITANGPVSLEAYAAGLEFEFIPAITNTGATTINITGASALGARNVFWNGIACVGGELRANIPVKIRDDGTRFHVVDSGFALPVLDTYPVVVGGTDSTKKVRFEVDGLTTATTRVITVPDADITLAATGVASGNVPLVNQTINATTRAATTALGTSLNHTLSDTSTTITGFSGVAGVTYHCRCLGAGAITHHATDLIITQTGASIAATAAGDTFDVEMITTTTCRIKNYTKADGTALVASGGSAATQAEQETATSTTTYVSPGRQQYHPSACKAWVKIGVSAGTPSVTIGYNVSSITDNGVGDFTVNFTTAFSTADYGYSGMAELDTGVGTYHIVVDGDNAPTTTAFRFQNVNVATTVATDPRMIGLSFFGDQ